jgi:hypothetical protein
MERLYLDKPLPDAEKPPLRVVLSLKKNLMTFDVKQC